MNRAMRSYDRGYGKSGVDDVTRNAVLRGKGLPYEVEGSAGPKPKRWNMKVMES